MKKVDVLIYFLHVLEDQTMAHLSGLCVSIYRMCCITKYV